ncbi:hypothetical protein [Comamonas aquatica]|uniref:hypothetical protein n=1 Tax=Comamonas aquatica TaxID=225991 RepID=UPI0021B0CB5E|nr:hypothetical protein [Comamonas aquatica]
MELAARWQRFAQTATASQVVDGMPISQQSCGRPAGRTSTVMKHAQRKWRSAACARKRRALGGSPSDFRRLYERSAASAQRVPPDSRRQTRFFGDFLVADKKVTRPPGRTPGLCLQSKNSF